MSMEPCVTVKLIIRRPRDGRVKTVTSSGIPIAGLRTVTDALTHAINEHNLDVTVSVNPLEVPTYTLDDNASDADWFDEPKPGAEYKLGVFGEWTEERSHVRRLHDPVVEQLRGRTHKVSDEDREAAKNPADERAQSTPTEEVACTNDGKPAELVSAIEPGEPEKPFETAHDAGGSEQSDEDQCPAVKIDHEGPDDEPDQQQAPKTKPVAPYEETAKTDEGKHAKSAVEEPCEIEKHFEPAPDEGGSEQSEEQSDEARSSAVQTGVEEPAKEADQPKNPEAKPVPRPRQLSTSVEDSRSAEPQHVAEEPCSEPMCKRGGQNGSPGVHIDDEIPTDGADQPQTPGAKPVARPRQLTKSVDEPCSVNAQPTAEAPSNKPVLKRAVLLLGESGNGKSTFLNCAINKFAHTSFEAACKNPKYAIPSVFEVPQGDTTTTIRVGREGEFERLKVGESGTQHCSVYRFRYRLESGQLCELEIIDTPGINDPQGEIRDNTILQSIVLFLTKRVPELHGICLVFQEGKTRLDTTFGHVIAEYLCRLHRNAAQNLLFCITNCGPKAVSTKTKPIVEKFLREQLRGRLGMEISMEGRTFCFEQDFFHYIHAMQSSDVQFDEDDVALYKKSWTSWTSKMDALLRTITELPPHLMEESIATYAARSVLIKLTGAMAEVAKVLCENIKLIEKLNQDIAACDLRDARLRGLMYTPKLALEKDKNVMPQTVCASPLCTEEVEGVKHYKQVCHEDCRANKYVVANKRGDEALRLCSAFKLKGIIWGWKPGDNCHKCGCSYKEHMHILFTQRVRTLKVVDPEIVAKLQDVRSAKQAKHDQLEINKMHLEMLKKEERFITKIGIKLAWIVEQDAILPVNDFKKAFLERQIKAAELSGQTEQARKLKEELANYEKECELMKQKFMKKPTKLRLKDIDELKEKLFALERSGETIKRLFDDMAEAETQMRNNADFVFDAQQPVHGRVY